MLLYLPEARLFYSSLPTVQYKYHAQESADSWSQPARCANLKTALRNSRGILTNCRDALMWAMVDPCDY